MIYAKIENGSIAKQGLRLPFSDGNTSFGKQTSNETLVQHGFYPIVDNQPTYDPQYQKIAGISFEVGTDEVVKTYNIQDIDIEVFKERKQLEIKKAFQGASVEPVTDSSGVTWSGGINSSLSLDGAVRIAEQAGATETTIYDNDDNPHTMNITDAKNVVMTIGIKYEQNFGKRQSLYKQIKDATTINEVENITWA